MGKHENLKIILEKYNKFIAEISKEFINELKSDSNTYKEVNKKLNIFEKEIIYNNFQSEEHKSLNILFLKYIKELLEDEKNDLPLTNRSKL